MTDFSKKEKSEWSEVHSDVVRYEGFEPPTFWFVAKHSIQLSYWRIQDVFVCNVLADCFI